MKIHGILLFSALFLASGFSHSPVGLAATSAASHEEFTRIVDDSIQWAQHLRDESIKGKGMDRHHATQEMKSLHESLIKMSQAYLELSKQPAPEVAETHFVAIKKHQDLAETELSKFETEFARPNPDYRALKKAAKQIAVELKSAANAHKAELSEIDVK